jgi:hypothetical protein
MAVNGGGEKNTLALTHRQGFGGLGAVGCDASCRFAMEAGRGTVVACLGEQHFNGGRRFPVGGLLLLLQVRASPSVLRRRACWPGFGQRRGGAVPGQAAREGVGGSRPGVARGKGVAAWFGRRRKKGEEKEGKKKKEKREKKKEEKKMENRKKGK